MPSKYSLSWMLASHISRLIVAALIPIITLPYVTRTLSPSGLGIYQFTFAFVANFLILGNLGIPTFGQREAASVRHDLQKVKDKASHLYALGIFAASTIYFILLAIAAFTPQTIPYFGLIALLGLTIPASAFSAEWLLLALDDFIYVSIRTAGLQIVFALCIFLFVKSPSDVFLYSLFVLGPQILACYFNWVRIKDYIDIKIIDNNKILNVFRASLPFLLSTIAISLYTNMDTVYLGLFYSNSDVGHHALAKRLMVAGIALSTSLGTLLVSKLSNTYTMSDEVSFSSLITLSFQFVLTIVLPATVGLVFLAPELTLLLGGASFEQAVLAIYFLAPCMVLVGVAHIALNQILIAKGLEKKAVYCWASGGIVSVLLGFTLVPRFGLGGAAATCTLSECLVTALAIYYARKDLRKAFPTQDFILAFAATSLMSLCLFFSKQHLSNVPIFPKIAMLILIGVLSFSILSWPIVKSIQKGSQKNKRKACFTK